MKHAFLDLIRKRRSLYNLTNKSTLSQAEIVKLVQENVKHTPSPFNSQGTRVLILSGVSHVQFWQIVRNELRKIIPADKFSSTDEKISSFSAAHGTLLFFEDWSVVESLQKQFPAYKDNFTLWAYQANAMAEFAVWTSLAENGMGASLQHYNPLVDEEVQKQFHVPPSWKLIAQMPFGVALHQQMPDKTFLPIDERVRVVFP